VNVAGLADFAYTLRQYRYAPGAVNVCMRRLLPRSEGGQRVVTANIEVTPRPQSFNERVDSFANRVEKVSAITHQHPRSQMACAFYGLVVRQLLLGWQPCPALDSAREEFTGWYERAASFSHFRDVLL